VRSVSFDRIADTYDETRGGTERGDELARAIDRHLCPGTVVEVGAGTGAVALPLTARGRSVLGVDLSAAMLRQARERLGARVVVADGYRLPVPDGAVPNAMVVWVLQLVPDIVGFLAEAARILARDGRLVVVPAGGQRIDDDEIEAIMRPLNHALRPPRDRPEQVVDAAVAAGLRLVDRTSMSTRPWLKSPEDEARGVEARDWSTLWDVPDDRWREVVEPAIAALRALPDPATPRELRATYDVLSFTRASEEEARH
jgi:SAM-dependent methyltransferase